MDPLLGVHSELGRLRQVLVCRPGLAQRRRQPGALGTGLFDAQPLVDQAIEEHGRFCAALRLLGVEVLDLHQLLSDTLARRIARNWLLDRWLAPGRVDAELAQTLRPWLQDLPAADLAERLISGWQRAELPFEISEPQGLQLAAALPSTPLLPPLPYSVLIRDASAWIANGVALARSEQAERRDESLLLGAVYHFHPRFVGCNTGWWGEAEQDPGQAWLSGGDVMALNKDLVLLGIGPASTIQAVSQLARNLLTRGGAERVLVAQLPMQPPGLQLDRLLCFCDRDLVVVSGSLLNAVRTFSLRRGKRDDAIEVHAEPHPLLQVLADALDLKQLRVVVSGGDPGGPWEDGGQLLATAPGQVLAWQRNVHTNALLREAGIEVIELPGGSLGRAGSHAYACPISREPL
ncbi:arginine deiminase family protein [Pelomonas sp. SE-A7]|uniref:arginine deiminase family protein n=1 Tax=Pelomonas sp. SE-A7 TaxID=3054953 RepID=UPI00259CE688|nr:arginine deiminase family protein [Pelomonas sp. SE-A7]MDM4764763.1 arginine deiminase family protein [Pelomonas sp. SE-A7]